METRLRPGRLDLVLAACLVGLQLTGMGEDDGLGGRHLLLSLVLVAAVALRRAAPLAVVLLFLVVNVVAVWLGEPVPDSIAIVLAAILAVYAAGAYLPVWRAAAVLVLWMCAEAIGLLQQGSPADDAAFAAAILCTAWAPGVVVRRLRMSERAARDAADQARQRERAGADEAITRERERIARELHDVVAHAVTLMVVQAAVAEELLDRDPATARQALASVQHTGRSAVTELARMLHLLREPEVAAAPLPSLATLPDLIAGAGQAGLQVELVEHGAAADAQVPAAVQICAYRVVQEAITNAARHSRNPHVRVVVSRSPDSVEIEVEDDGGAGPRGEPGTGHGLIGLRERVAVFGGTLQAGSRDGSGYRVVARLPVAGAIPA